MDNRTIEQVRDNETKPIEEIKKLERKILIKDAWNALIVNIGFDYDGCQNSIDGLKRLVDEVVRYAKCAIDNDDTSHVYTQYTIDGSHIDTNILDEEIIETCD